MLLTMAQIFQYHIFTQCIEVSSSKSCIQALKISHSFQMQDISDKEQMQQYIQPQRGQQDSYRGNVKQAGFHVRDAPWDHPAPDSSSTMDFPALGAGAPAAGRGQGAAPGRSVVWGPAIKR